MAEQTRIKEIQLGNVGATVWDHGAAATPRRSVTFYRLYAHGIKSGRLRNFGLDDLLLLSVVADRAHRFVFELSLEDAAQERLEAGAGK